MENTQCFPHDEEWIIQALENLSRGHDLQETSSSSEGENFLNLMTKEEMMGKDFDFVKSQVCRECDDVIGLLHVACTFCKVLYHPECATKRVVGDFFCSQKCKRSATKISNKRKRDSDSEEEEDYTRISHVRSSLQDFDVDDETYSPDECKKSPVKSRRISAKKPRWTSEEDAKLIELKRKFGDLSWAKISENMEDRTSSQCYQRWHRVLNPAILKGPWSKEETDILARIVIEMENDKISWSQVAKHIPGRTDIQCRYQYLKLVRSGKQKFLRKSGGSSHEERRNPHRINRKRSSKDQVDNIPDSDSEILDEEEIEDEISS